MANGHWPFAFSEAAYPELMTGQWLIANGQ